MQAILSFLELHKITYDRYDHPPVFTVEQGHIHCAHIPGFGTKNLFLRDHKGRLHFLVVIPDYKTIDLKSLGTALGVGKLGFASPERLKKYLGIEPGSVSLLALLNDQEKAVQVIIDSELWENSPIHCHPLINSSTLVISRENLERFMQITGHAPQIRELS